MNDVPRAVTTQAHYEALMATALAVGVTTTALIWPLVSSPLSAVSVGGGVGLLAAITYELLRVGTLAIDGEHVVLTRRAGTKRIPCEAVERITLDPSTATRLKGEPQTVLVTLHGSDGEAIRCNLDGAEAAGLLSRIAAPIGRRQLTAIERGERVVFQDPRRFPLRAVMNKLVVALGAIYLLVALSTMSLQLALVIGLLAVVFGSVADASRAVWTWFHADRGGGLVVASQGLLHIADAPRQQAAANIYRDAGVGGPWIPWHELRAVRREGYGLIIEFHSAPPVKLSASTEGLFSLQQLLERQLERARVRFAPEVPAAIDEEATVAAEARRRAGRA